MINQNRYCSRERLLIQISANPFTLFHLIAISANEFQATQSEFPARPPPLATTPQNSPKPVANDSHAANKPVNAAQIDAKTSHILPKII